MMNKNTLTLIALLATSLSVMAQGERNLRGESEYAYDEMMQLWHNTGNAAGMQIDSVRKHGVAEFAFDRRVGSYHRVQEGSQQNNLSFFTERYQPIGKYLCGYGSFRFNNGSTEDRAWSDVIRTYNSNPFISGSSVAGRYDHQDFTLAARVGTIELNGWRVGMALDYGVADLSRLRDPRSRSRLLDYKLMPSVTYTMGSSTVGVAGWYNRRKEKMPTLTTVQNNPNLYYYQMSGLDAISGNVGGYSGFSREYVNHAFGAELEYGYKAAGFSSVNTLSIEQQQESIYEQYKREPGKYFVYNYGFSTQNRIVRTSVVHQLDAEARWQQGYADEYRPQLIIEKDSVKGYSSYRYENMLTYRKRYQIETLDAQLHYRANFVKGKAVRSYAGITAQLQKVSQKHLLPTSTFDLQTLFVNAEYGHALLSGNRLWITADAGYHFAQKADIVLSNPDSDYAREVLIKDMDYYSANCFRGRLSVRYQFPVTLKKKHSLCYVKAWGETLQAQNSFSGNNFGISLGIFN